MSARRLPVRPNLDQLKHQARDLLNALHAVETAAVAELEAHLGAHVSGTVAPLNATLAHAQLILARSYEAPSWPRLVQAVRLVNAIWDDDLETVRSIIAQNPRLLHEQALIRKNSNWGPPVTYAANVGRDRIIRMLHASGATDLESAANRAALQGHVDTARMIYAMAGNPPITADALDGTAYTLSATGTELLLALGAAVRDAD
jgi:hypothetical protein